MSEEKKTNDGLESLPFEQALEKLEALVSKMETGKLPLEELIRDFDAGSRLVKVCRGKLDALEHKIELLTRDDGQKGEWTDFESAVPSASRNAPPPPAKPEESEGNIPF